VEVRYSPLTHISRVTLSCDFLEMYTSLMHTLTVGGRAYSLKLAVVAYRRISFAVSKGISIFPR
jgi:hypothetical protein